MQPPPPIHTPLRDQPAHSLSPYHQVARRLPHPQLRQPLYASQLGRLRLPSVSSPQHAENSSPLNYLWEQPTSCGVGSTATPASGRNGCLTCTPCPATLFWEWTDARPPGDVTVPLPRMYATSTFPFFLVTHPWCPFHQAATWVTRTFDLSRPCRKCGYGDGFGKPFCQSSFGTHGGGAESPRARTNTFPHFSTFPKSRLIPNRRSPALFLHSPGVLSVRSPSNSAPVFSLHLAYHQPALAPSVGSILRYGSPPGSSVAMLRIGGRMLGAGRKMHISGIRYVYHFALLCLLLSLTEAFNVLNS